MLDIVEFKKMCEKNGIEQEKSEALYEMLKGKIKPRKYGLVWEEQEEDIEKSLKDRYTVLHEVTEREIRLDVGGRTHSLIEGDNLEALTFLKNSGKKVDVIYIDPPYNTTNRDFIYNDDYVDKEDAWRHSKWLSFMNKRLVLARELLTDDGVIFISIDDNEMAQLKLLCDQIFGEKNFISNIIWRKQGGGKQDSKYLANNCEYILAYRKTNQIKNFNGKILEDTIFNRVDDTGRKYRLMSLDFGSLSYSPSLDYPIQLPNGELVYPGGDKENHIKRLNGEHKSKDWIWRCSKQEFNKRLDRGDIEYTYNKNTKKWKVQERLYWSEGKTTTHENLITDFTNRTGNNQIKNLFGEKAFSYPKPTNLIDFLVGLYPNKNATILDFFAGSGTTAHAVLELNKEDNGNRQVILCTNNENNIAEEVTYERIKRVMEGYNTPKGKSVEGIPGNLRYFKVDSVAADEDIYTLEDSLLEVVVPFIQFAEDAWTITTGKSGFTYLDDRVTIYNDPYHLDEDFLDHIKGDVFYIYDGWMDYLDIEELKDIRVVPIPKEFFKLFR